MSPKMNADNSPFRSKASPSSGLVRFGEIEAVDAKDLLSQFGSNLDRIAEKNLQEEKKIWAERTRAEIQRAYYSKASAALKKQWDLCGTTRHNFRNLDVKGTTILVCANCSFASGTHEGYVGYNDTTKGALAKRLMELDEEAGILNWPTVDDYKKPVVPQAKLPPVRLPFMKKKKKSDV